MKKITFYKSVLLLLFFLSNSYLVFSQVDPTNPNIRNVFDVRYQTTVKGDMLTIGNNIVNRSVQGASPTVNYNDVGSNSTVNDSFNMQYIDMDNDNTTFNSSRATLVLPDPNCSRIVHAGLYWAATYRYETGNDPSTGRSNTWNTCKFKMPGGGGYVNITATDVLYNGFADTNQNSVTHGPYACFADVTALVANNPTKNGPYVVANIRVSKDGRSNSQFPIPGGVSGGWQLVVVYENVNLPGKKITTFDGYAVIASGNNTSLDIPVSGFVTLPAPLPVRAKFGVGALEGDNGISGDRLQIKANSLPLASPFTDLYNTPLPAAPVLNNFFNSSITVNGAYFNGRVPSSLNTLGWDIHLDRINNPANSVIPNDETGVRLRATSTQDKYDIFFASFDVEIIEPKIPLVKTVVDFSNNNLDGQQLSLGQEFYYSLCFQNIGNDDAISYEITDQLPTNIIFPINGTIQPGDLILPPGVTYTYNPTTKRFVFTIPNNLVEIGDPSYCIKIKVRTPINCNDVIDACANIVTNQAFQSYHGELNTQIITDNPSYNGFDVCNYPTPGATNYLTNLDLCTFEHEEVLCGNSVILTAANGYSSYVWTNEAGQVIGNTQSITVSTVGTYHIALTTPAPCISLQETITVVNFADAVNLTNPVIPFASTVATCPNDGSQLPKIYLCGINDSQFIQTQINNATNIIWQKLNTPCLPSVLPDCANTNPSCTWTNIATGPDYLADTAGQYRVLIYFQNGCFRPYYFNVYKNVLNPTITATNIVCNTLGTIKVSSIPAGYEYSLSPTGPWQTSNLFTIPTAGSYTVYIRQIGVAGGCLFEFPNIAVLNKIPQFVVTKTDKLCNNGFGSISISTNNVDPQYYFKLFQGATLISSVGPQINNNHTFTVAPGTYTVNATTDDGCTFTQQVVVNAIPPIQAVATATSSACNPNGIGTINIAASGGTPTLNFAILSINGTTQSPLVYQPNSDFTIPVGGQGTYQFIVVDDNNCTFITNTVQVNVETPLVFTATPINVSCNGANNGSLTISTTNPQGYALTYSINGTTFQTSNVFSNLAPGTYTITIKAIKGTVECIYTVNGTITESGVLDGQSQLVQNLTCTTQGSISAINVTGGTTPYTYSINGVTFQASNVFSNLTAGTYTITIKDARGCVKVTAPITFTTPAPPTDLTFTSTALSCPALSSNITATVVGGTAPYVFQIISPSTIAPNTTTTNSGTFNNLAAGTTYSIKVTDSKNCVYQENYTIGNLVPISANATVNTSVTCFNGSNGQATINVSGFSTNYSYSINGATPINSALSSLVLSNLTAGNYSVLIRDLVTNCNTTVTFVVAGPPSALVINASGTQPTCIATGIITATATGGWGSYQYSLTQPNGTILPFQSSGVFSNQTQLGTYTIKVKDANGCEQTTTVLFNAITNPTLAINPAVSVLCYQASTGSTIAVTASGGTSPYQYQNNGGALQSSNVFSNVTPGNYIIKVIDANGCEATVSQTINPQLTAQATLTKDLDCTTSPNAIIGVTVNGGISPYQYQIKINSGSWGTLNPVIGTTISYTTANAGTYQFQITDAQGCVFQTNTITVLPLSNPSILSITPIIPSCNGFNNGTLTVNIDATSGTGPFMYNINNGTYQNSNVFTGLTSGSYTISVRDSKNCIDTETFVLTQPQLLVGQSQLVQPITCINTTGTIQATSVSGGTSPYQYSINGVTFVTNPVFSGLSAGTYTITIKDDKGCTITTTPITLTVPQSPTDITLTSSAITCPTSTTTIQATAIGGLAPYTYQITSPSITNPTSTSGNTASFTNLSVTATTIFTVNVTDANGCVYQKNITVQTIPLISVVGVLNNNVACLNDTNGGVRFTVSGFSSNYSYSVNSGTVVTNQTNPLITLSNLAAGNYSILVTDLVTNCTATASVTVLTPSAQLVLTAPITQPTCNVNGSVNATATGGWGSYQYTLTYPSATQVTQASGLFSNLSQLGTYSIKVTDANGCEVSQTFTLIPYVNPTLVVNLTASDLCYDTTNAATIAVTASGGTPTYQYQIQLNSGTFSALQANAVFSNLSPGTYTIRVVDNFGCTATVSQVISDQLIPKIDLIKGLDCSTSPDATINLDITGGTSPYQYQVNINSSLYGASTAIATNPFNYSVATAGTYQFLITDSQGCSFTSSMITVNPIVNPNITSLTSTPIFCNGGNDATITTVINTSAGVGPFEYSIDGITFQPSPLFSGLTAGTYTVTVRDSRLCTDTETITITQPNPVNFTISKTDLTCSGIPGGGTTPGSITVSNVSGGTQPLEYILRNITFTVIATYSPVTNEDHTFPNQDFGVYSVEVIDANGCSKFEYITIASPPNSLIAVNATANCSTGATVEVTVLAVIPGYDYEFGILNAPNAPYVVAPNAYQPSDVVGGVTSTFTNLVPGLAYTFVVHDKTSDCYFIQDVPSQLPPSSSITTTIDVAQNSSCAGSSNGNVSFTMNNFDATTTSVSYTIYETVTNNPTTYSGTSPVLGATTPVAVTNLGTLPFGNYYIVITENGGCTTTSPVFSIFESTNLLTVTATSTNDNCNTNAGVVNAVGQYGTPGYLFILQDTITAAPLANNLAWNATSSFNVESGNYIVYIKDSYGCIQQTSVTVGLDSSPEILSVTVNNPCANEGSFEVNVTRDNSINIGIAPYTYQVDGNTTFVENAPTFTVQNLFSGNHIIRITDINGCFFDFPFVINQNLSGTTSVLVQPTCVPANSGSIQATAANGTGTYSFTINTSTPVTISNGTSTANFTNIPPGNYIVTVNDGNCSIPLSISLETPTPVDFSIISEDPSCNADTNGVIEATLNPSNNDNPPYTYTLSAPSFTTITQVNNGLFNVGLGENNYTLTVVSNKGCELTLPISLTDPDVLVATDPNTYSFNCTPSNTTGTITLNGLTVTGGNPNYFYSLDNINFQPSNTFVITDTGVNQSILVYIKDSKGCTTTFTYLINTIETISNPVIVQNTPLSCQDDENITVSFTASNPTGNYTYQLLPAGPVTAFTGTSFTPAALTSTGQFTYQIINTATGCSLLATYDVLPFPVTNVSIQPVQAVDCFGNTNGQLSFTLQNYTGSYDYEVFTSPGNVSVLTGTSSLATFTSPNTLAAGNYYVVIIENVFPACTITSPVTTITSPSDALSLQLIASNDRDCLSDIGTILANASGGTSPYLYQLSNAGGIVQAFSSNNYFEGLADGSYTVTITDDNNCTTNSTITIGLDLAPQIAVVLLNPCGTEGNYQLEITRTDGIAPFVYVIDGGAPTTNNSGTFTVSNLLSGSHTITVTDANGCSDTKSITIINGINTNLVVNAQPSCANGDGEIQVNASSGSGNYSFTINSSPVQTNGTGLFTALNYGVNYTITVTDTDNSCVSNLNITLETPTPVLFTLASTNPLCVGSSDGSITVTLPSSNNNTPYTYTISDGTNTTTQPGPYFGGLTQGTYTITVTSNRGCDLSMPTTISDPTLVTIVSADVSQFACNADNTPSSVTINNIVVNGGATPYLYSINGVDYFPNPASFTVLDIGVIQNITIRVKDANNCEASYPLAPITPLPTISNVTFVQNQAYTCIQPEIVDYTIVGGSGNYTYQLLPSGPVVTLAGNTFQATFTTPGSYVYHIIDTATSCSINTDPYEFLEIPQASSTATAINQVLCYGDSTGSLQFTVTGFTGNYDYQVIDAITSLPINPTPINGSTLNPIVTVSNLPAGNYYVAIFEITVPNCDFNSNVVTITSPADALSLTIAQTAPVTCVPNQAAISVTDTSGGTSPYQYQLQNGATVVVPFGNVSLFEGLDAGIYTVTVRDGNNCETSQSLTLTAPTAINASHTVTNAVLACYGNSNASIEAINVTGGQGVYSYTLTNLDLPGATWGPQQNPLFNGLGAGNYTLTVNDGWGCEFTINPIVISQPAIIEATASLQTQITCLTVPEIKITATGGTPPYFVNGTSFASTIILTATMPPSGAGTFQYTVTDSNNCTPAITNPIIIQPIAPIAIDLNATLITVNCNNDDNALIVADATGGLGNYVYYLLDSSNNVILGPQNNGSFNNIAGNILPGNTYYVKVTSGDCEMTSTAILVTEPPALASNAVTTTNVLCNGERSGTITINASGGSQPYQYAISPNLAATSDVQFFDGLSAGSYDVLIQDKNGCFRIVTAIITEPSPLNYTNQSFTEAPCYGDSGSVTVTAIGGTPPYMFSFDNENNYALNGSATYTNTTEVFGGQAHTVYIKDANGCKTRYDFTLAPSAYINPIHNILPGCPTLANPNANTLEIYVESNVSAFVTYSLDDELHYQSSSTYYNLSPGQHTVYIHHTNGCTIPYLVDVQMPALPLELTAVESGLNQITATATEGVPPYSFEFNGNYTGSNNVYIFSQTGLQTIKVTDDNGCEQIIRIPATFYDIEIPNFFTPGSDGYNDGWSPLNIDNFPGIITKVFDRYGRLVATLRLGQKWDGTYNNNPLPTGDYWYLIEVNDDTGRTFVGNVTLYR